mgnify:CR=1 FL=1
MRLEITGFTFHPVIVKQNKLGIALVKPKVLKEGLLRTLLE